MGEQSLLLLVLELLAGESVLDCEGFPTYVHSLQALWRGGWVGGREGGRRGREGV